MNDNEQNQGVHLAEWLIRFDREHTAEIIAGKKSSKSWDPNGLIKQLRRMGCSTEQCQAWMELQDCRQRANKKFDGADSLFFTRRSFEQSSGSRLANWKRSWFVERQNSPTVILDLCCGMGGDAIEFNRSFPVLAVDRDPVLTTLAAENLKLAGSEFPSLTLDLDVQLILDIGPFETVGQFVTRLREYCDTNITEPSLSAACDTVANWCQQNQLENHRLMWHLDPDRRSETARHIRLEDFSPDLDFIQTLHQRLNVGLLKVAPATIIPDLWQSLATWTWLGEQRECKQLVGCFENQPASGKAAAVWNRRLQKWDSCAGIFSESEQTGQAVTAIKPEGFLIEFHSAVYTAGLADHLAAKLQAERLEGDSYYIANSFNLDWSNGELFSCFKILSVLPMKPKAIAHEIRARDGRLVEVKKRQADTAFQSQLTKSLKETFRNRSELELSILLVKSGQSGKVQAVLAQRITNADASLIQEEDA